MSEIIYFSGQSILTNNLNIDGLDDFLKIQHYFHLTSGVLDRSNTIAIPFKHKILNPLPKMDLKFKLNYKDCVMSRVEELNQLHLKTNKTFRLLYSGGIDSTAILSGFIEYFGIKRTSKILEISCTPDSIDENPWVWNRYIAPGNFKVTTSLNHAHNWDDNVITIQGEGNDHLFGGLGSGRMSGFLNNMYCPVDVDTLTEYLAWTKNDTSLTNARFCAEQIMRIVDIAPMPITNMYTLGWWYKFVLDWEATMIRALSQSTLSQLPVDCLQTTLVQFFNTENFQQWSMKFHADYPASYAENENYKLICKDMILKILNIPEYAGKNKFMSWPRVHSLTRSCVLIDSNFKLYHNATDLLKFVCTY